MNVSLSLWVTRIHKFPISDNEVKYEAELQKKINFVVLYRVFDNLPNRMGTLVSVSNKWSKKKLSDRTNKHQDKQVILGRFRTTAAVAEKQSVLRNLCTCSFR
jgi:hypothetical protein